MPGRKKKKRKRTAPYMLGLLEKKKNNNFITITNLNIGKMNINMYICFFFLIKSGRTYIAFCKIIKSLYYPSRNRIEEQEAQTAVAVKKNTRLQLTNKEEEE